MVVVEVAIVAVDVAVEAPTVVVVDVVEARLTTFPSMAVEVVAVVTSEAEETQEGEEGEEAEAGSVNPPDRPFTGMFLRSIFSLSL